MGWIAVTLYSRHECCLCDEARTTILSMGRQFRLHLEEVNVDEEPSLAARFGDYVPVVKVGQRITLVSRVSPQALAWALRSVQDAV